MLGSIFAARAQELIEVPVSGEWESVGNLYENEEVLVEIDYKLSLKSCDQADFGNSNHLYRFRITAKKPSKVFEDKFVSFVILYQDCQGVYMCKTASVNIGVKRKSDVWDGVQPLSDPNLDNSFQAKRLIVPFTDVRVSKIRNSTKDGECTARATPYLEKMNKKEAAQQKVEEKAKDEPEETEEILLSDSQFYPEVKIIKEAKFRLEPDVFSSSVGNLPVARKVSLLGRQDAFWKIKYKDREGFILIADNNIDSKDASSKLAAALASEKSKAAKVDEVAEEQVVQAPAAPVEKPAPPKLLANETLLLQDVKFYTRIDQTRKPDMLVKDAKITILAYDRNYWQVDVGGKKGYIADDNASFTANKTIGAIKSAYLDKVAKAEKTRIEEAARMEADRIEREKAERARVDQLKNNSVPAVVKAIVEENPDLFRVDREAKFRKSPKYSSEYKNIPALEQVQVLGYYNAYWKVTYKGEVGFLAEDMMYIRESPYLLNLKANPIKQLEPPKALVITDNDMPEYPGGLTALSDDIVSKMRYRFSTRSGKVLESKVELLVDEKGMVESTTIITSLSIATDEEIALAVKKIKPFKPAIKKGVPVKGKVTLAVLFK